MNLKRILFPVISFLTCILLIYGWIKYDEGVSAPYPINIGSFFTIGSVTITPETILDDIRGGKGPLLGHVQPGLPDNPNIISNVGWLQNEFLEIAKAIQVEIWDDDPNKWHLYRMTFYTSCENPNGEFETANLYYYQKVKENGKRMYSVRAIEISPQNSYIAFGGDTFYPSPLIGEWTEIDLEKITMIPAEKALALAEQQEGSDIRKQVNNACWIHVNMWPWEYERSSWMVNYGGNINLPNEEIWIPSK